MTAAPTAIGWDPSVAPVVSTTDWAMVRVANLLPPAEAAPATRHAALVSSLARALGEVERLRPQVEDELFAAAGSPPRPAVLAVRRHVHNGRDPKPELLAELGDLPAALTGWLSARRAVCAATDRVRLATADALAADRAALAGLCGDAALRRAAALVSVDLMRAVDRAAQRGAAIDRRAVKSEPRVLRHALRAATRTTPLTWSAAAAWGKWTDDAAADPGDIDGIEAPLELVSRCEPDRRAVESVTVALLAAADNPLLHLAPGSWIDGEYLMFHRAVSSENPTIRREEQVSVPLSAALRALLRVEGPQRELVSRLAARLPLPPDRAVEQAGGYVARLRAAGVLVPVPPVDPQDERPLETLAGYAAQQQRPDVAAALRTTERLTADFAALPAGERPAALAVLREQWTLLPGEGARDPLTEDVGLLRPLRLGPSVATDLTSLAPLFEVFDAFTVIRRAARDRFVARFGAGGTCPSVAEFAADYADVWRGIQLVGPAGELPDPDAAGSALRELAALRRAVVSSSRRGCDVTGANDVVLDGDAVRSAAEALPGWLRSRPASYAVFGQPLDGPGLCVNQIYGGWGRFASRFLPGVAAQAREEIAASIRAGLGPDARPAQVRPVGGFNANLHPRLVADEIAETSRWGTLHSDDLELTHDIAGDQLRIRHRPTGELLDVLYLGFLVPLSLPQRLVPVLNDLGSGLVDLRPLRGQASIDTAHGPVLVQPRLRAGSTVLLRRRWLLAAGQVERWRADLDAHRDAPGLVAARLRAELGLPRQVFVGAGAASGPPRYDLSEVIEHMQQPRPQYLDLGSAVHLACLSRTLTRYGGGIVLEEALPAPRPGRRVVEYVVETYRR